MTLDQGLAFTILGSLVVLLVWDRIRYDLVALLALLASVVVGIVPAAKAFEGFSSDIVVIVGSALVVSAAVARSGLIDQLMQPLAPYMRSSDLQVFVLVTIVAALSAFVKNIGALAMFMPIAFQIARRTGKPVSRLLMPLSFGALLGGLTTLIGTSPNIIVSRLREELLGEPFRMFDFAPVGACIAAAGIAFLTLGWRLIPKARDAGISDEAFSIDNYQTEVQIGSDSPLVGETVAHLEKLGHGEVRVIAVIRERYRRFVPTGEWELMEGDVCVLECSAQALEHVVRSAKLDLVNDDGLPGGRERRLTIVEAVLTPGSAMIGRTIEEMHLRERQDASVLALSRYGERIDQRLHRVRFSAGDLLVLRLPADDLADRLASLGCLPLAGRNLRIGRSGRPWLPVAILAVAMALAGSGIASVPIAFFGAAVGVLVFGCLTINEAYDSVDWSVLALLGALIPVSEALRTTGGTDLIAAWLSTAAAGLSPHGALALMLVAAMVVTPFLNNAATVLVMAPIAASFAGRLGLQPDPFLMAVAIGAACDFLTPIGHQCNTLVMGPGGYRFGDYWRLGLPLSIIVAVLGTFLIGFFWPIR